MVRKRLIGILLIAFIVLQTVIAYGASTTSKYTGKSYKHAVIFDNMLILDGLDVSAWNENIDWNKVKADGIDFVIVRIAGMFYGSGKMYHDSWFTRHFQGAKDAGLLVGGYVFSQSITTTEAIAEVQFVKNTLASYRVSPSDFDLPIFMDREYDRGKGYRLEAANLSKEAETEIELTFCNEIKKLGADAGVYANTTYLNNNTNAQELLNNGHTVWVAQYYSECEYSKTNYSLWQYTSSGKIDGYSGNLDTNFWYFNKNLEAREGLSTDINSFTASTTPCLIIGNNPIAEINLTLNNVTLKKDVDFEIIRTYTDSDSKQYALIRGIGNYHGYRAIPIEKKDGKITSSYSINKYISGVIPNTTVSTLKGNINAGENVSMKVFDVNNNEVTDNSPLGTGMMLKFYDENNEVIGSISIAVKGDVYADSKITASDYMKIKNHIMKSDQQLTKIYAVAADVYDDNLITASDYMKIKNHIMGKTQIL